MNDTFKLAALALASSLAVLAGCDRPAENTARDGVTTESEPAVAATEPSVGERIDEATREAGQAIDDSRITAAIKGKYVADDTLKALDISVSTTNGAVTLTGQVQNDGARSFAEQIAHSVDGVVSVDNQLTVGTPG